MSVDQQLKEAIFRQVRLSSALLSIVLSLDLGTDLEHALDSAARGHHVDKTDLAIAWTELVLRNSQTIISEPWRQHK